MIIFIWDSKHYREAVYSVLFTDKWIDKDREYEDKMLLI